MRYSHVPAFVFLPLASLSGLAFGKQLQAPRGEKEGKRNHSKAVLIPVLLPTSWVILEKLFNLSVLPFLFLQMRDSLDQRSRVKKAKLHRSWKALWNIGKGENACPIYRGWHRTPALSHLLILFQGKLFLDCYVEIFWIWNVGSKV